MSEQTKAIQKKPENRLQGLLRTPDIQKRFEEMLGKRAPAFMSSIISSVNSNPELKKCEPMSVISAAAVAASMDLPINPSLGFAFIVPYKEFAQFQIGWKGYVQLAIRSGQYKKINVAPVKEGQLKSYNPFTGDMEFVNEALSDEEIGYLLYFRTINGYEKYFYMTREEVETHGKRYSKMYQRGKGMWVSDFTVMALKTVVRMGLSKFGILSVDMQKALEVDQAAIDEKGEPKYIDSVEEKKAPPSTKSKRLSKIVEAADETEPSEFDADDQLEITGETQS